MHIVREPLFVNFHSEKCKKNGIAKEKTEADFQPHINKSISEIWKDILILTFLCVLFWQMRNQFRSRNISLYFIYVFILFLSFVSIIKLQKSLLFPTQWKQLLMSDNEWNKRKARKILFQTGLYSQLSSWQERKTM